MKSVRRGPVIGAVLLIGLAWTLLRGGYSKSDGQSTVGDAQFKQAAQKNLTEWRSTLFARTMQLLKDVEKKEMKQAQPQHHTRFNLLSPIVTCPKGERMRRVGGDGDGGKLVCPSMLTSECVVYSLGSREDTRFEEDVLKNTPCQVVTFDCTVPGHSLGPRHKYVKKCLGTKSRMKADPENWITLQAAMRQNGHDQLTLLKMDIEAFEYDVLSQWHLEDANLPLQISMELHYWGIYAGTPAYNNSASFENTLWPLHEVTLAELSLFSMHLANLGYAIVSREDNELVGWCSELTFLRVDTP